MGKAKKFSRPKRALDFSIDLPPLEVVDYRVQSYEYFVNVRLLHGSGVNPKRNLSWILMY